MFAVALSDFGPIGGVQTRARVDYIVVTNVPAQIGGFAREWRLRSSSRWPKQYPKLPAVNSGLTLLSGTGAAGSRPYSVISGAPYDLSGRQTGRRKHQAFDPVTTATHKLVILTSNGGNTTDTVIGSGILPSASFSGTPTTGIVPLAVIFTDSSTGTITNRSWAFGDGGSTNTLNTTVAYTYNSTGTNSITLVVTGPFGVSTNTRVNYIVVTNGSPRLVVAPGSRDFGFCQSGQSGTQTFALANAGLQTLTGTAAVSGAPFGLISGSPYAVNSAQTGLVSVSFGPLATGAFTSSVVFTSNGGVSTNTLTGSAAVAPTAAFSGTPTNGNAPLQVNFTDASSGTVTGRSWVFGDGGTSTLASPSHSYTNAGTFPVSLTVSGPLGSNTLPLANYITVTNVTLVAPIAAFTATPTNGAAPLLVNFTDASSGTITNRFWMFGDGATSVVTSPSHTYSNAGVYSVALTVSGPGGLGLTNLANLIEVTNVVNISPTVTIVRPADGMIYPTATNLTITIVASATANDGAAISKIEFFADGTKLGETPSNPGTNLLVNPTPGSHIITGRATDTFGLTNTSPSHQP